MLPSDSYLEMLTPTRVDRLINILLNNCEHMSHRLDGEKRYQDACRDPTLASGLDLKRQFVAPLAKRVRARVDTGLVEMTSKSTGDFERSRNGSCLMSKRRIVRQTSMCPFSPCGYLSMDKEISSK